MEEKEFNSLVIYKKWFRTKDKQGFCSIGEWFDAGKVTIDIGEVTGETKATKCYVDAYDFLTWVNAVRDRTAAELYPQRDQCPSPESFVSFGGSGEVSRIFKAHWWKETVGNSGFAFKCGHFKGTPMGSGGIKPDFNDVISMNMIKMTHTEVATIATKLDHALLMWSRENEWKKMFSDG